MMLTAGLVALLGSIPTRSYADCTVEVPWLVCARDAASVVLRATPDTVSDGVYYDDMGTLRRSVPAPASKPLLVHGQVFEVVSARGPGAAAITRHREVIVIWWSLGSGCQRRAPAPVRRFPDSEVLVVKRPRDPSQWIGGTPTYDVEVGDWVYAPSLSLGPDSTLKPMSVTEYLGLYESRHCRQ